MVWTISRSLRQKRASTSANNHAGLFREARFYAAPLLVIGCCFCCTSAEEDTRLGVGVSFVASKFIKSLFGPLQTNHRRPSSSPSSRIVDRKLISDLVRGDTGEALYQMQILCGAKEIALP